MSKFKNVQVLTAAAMLAAIAVILGFFKIPLSPTLEIRFAVLPIAVSGAMFGPAMAAVVGILSDVGGYLLKPTGPFFPGFTVSAAISGVIFGLLLYKKKATWLRVTGAMTIRTVVVSILLNSYWLTMLYHKGFVPILAGRITKEMILLPIFIAMILALLKLLEKTGMFSRFERKTDESQTS